MRKRLRNEKVMVERTDNIFGIIGMGHMEIKHSNFLAWMLDPHNPHGCGSKFLYLLMSKRGIEVPRSLPDLRVVREKEHDIDLFCVSREWRLVVVIENKVFAPLSEGQLDKYRTYTEEKYRRYRRVYVY